MTISYNHRMKTPRGWILGLCVASVVLISCGGAHSPRFVNNVFARADQLYNTGNYNEAAALYRRLLNEEDALPDELLAETYRRLADSYNQLEQPEAAVVILQKYLELDASDSEINYKMGKSLLALDRVEEANIHFRQMLGYGSDTKAYNGIGVTLDLLTNHREAQLMYLKGLEGDPDYIPILNNLALSYVLSGDSDEAIKIFKRINFGRAGNPKLRQNLAMAYAMVGNEQEAERVSRIDLTPEEAQQNLDFFGRLRDQRIQALLGHDSIAATQEDILSQVIGGQGDVRDEDKSDESDETSEDTPADDMTGGTRMSGDMPERGRFTVQIGVYRNRVIAQNTARQLQQAGFKPRLHDYEKKDGEYQVLRLGDFESSKQARQMVRTIYGKTQLLGEIYLLEE